MFTVDPMLPIAVLAGVWAAASWWHWSFYRRVLPGKPPRWRTVAVAARLFAITLLAAIACRPAFRTVFETEERSRLYLLRDRSDSMAIRDQPGRLSRQETIDALLGRYRVNLEEIARQFDVVTADFAATCDSDGPPENTAATAIGDALQWAVDHGEGQRVNSVILLSDGRNTGGRAPSEAARELHRRTIPIHAVVCGRTEPGEATVDGILRDLHCPPTVEKKGHLPVRIDGRWRGLAGRTVQIVASIDGVEALRETVAPENNDTPLRRDLTIPLDVEAGYHKVRIVLETGPDEVSPANNHLESFFKARDEGIRVLLLESSLRPEFKFLRRHLETTAGLSPTIHSPFWLRTQEGRAFLQALPVREYDVVILGDLTPDMIHRDTWQALRNAIANRGSGLLLIGGPLSLDPVLWSGNPAAACLPVTVAKAPPTVTAFQMLAAERWAGHFLAAPLRELQPSPTKRNQMLGLRTAGVRPRATAKTILVDTENTPILAIRDYFSGRTAALLTDCTWNWYTGSEMHRSRYRQFWTRMVYWLARREEGLDARLSILLARTRLPAGVPIVVTADLVDRENRPIRDADVSLTITRLTDNTGQTIPMPEEATRYRAAYSPKAPGDYAVRASAQTDDGPMNSNELRFTVFSSRLEDREIIADAPAMKDLAARTGGSFRPLERLPQLLERLPDNSDRITIRRTGNVIPLWDRWPILILLLLAVNLEWFARRRMALP